MGDVPMHWYYAGIISPPGDPDTDEVSANIIFGWDLGVPTSGGVDVKSGLVMVGDLRRPPS